MQKIELEEIENSKVFLRSDMDVPLDEKGEIQSTFRIKRCLPTIKLLLEKNNNVCIFTKIGRPENREDKLSTKKLVKILEKQLKEKIEFIDSVKQLETAVSKNKICIFENTRFFNWEKISKLKDFSPVENVSNIFDYYVDEAFAMSHRKETSNYLVPQVIGKISLGLNYKKELLELSKIKEGDLKKPAYFVLGGAKAKTKIPMIKKLISSFDKFLIGGALPKEKGLMKQMKSADKLEIGELKESEYDISKDTSRNFKEKLSEANTIIWNGPMGVFEQKDHAEGTKEIIDAIEKNKNAYKLAGGGDTISAIEKYGNFENYTFISTGGGAMFNYLSGGDLNLNLD